MFTRKLLVREYGQSANTSNDPVSRAFIDPGHSIIQDTNYWIIHTTTHIEGNPIP